METIAEIEHYFDRLWPLNRSLTGDGVRQSLDILGEIVPLTRIEVPTGTQVYDWQVPKEWRVREAYFIAPNGERFCDVKDHNLHLVGYSEPFCGRISRSELDSHLYSLPERPHAIPYVTSYYQPRWGFCLPHRVREALPDGEYEVVIDTELVDGSLTIAEAVLPGATDEEVLISTYTCHPSLANNELSGPLTAAFLYRRLAALRDRRLTFRFVFLPETIGSIAYLARRGNHLKEKLVAGYVITCCGDPAPFTYKRSRRGQSLADRAAVHVLQRHSAAVAKSQDRTPRILDFFPTGSDERQYCSPGFDLPVGSIMRSMYGTFPEYHTSDDNRDFVSFEAMHETVGVYTTVCRVLDRNRTFQNLAPFGEPQLGRRGLYPTTGAATDTAKKVGALMWVLNLSDGTNDLLEVAERSGLCFVEIAEAAEKLETADLLQMRPNA